MIFGSGVTSSVTSIAQLQAAANEPTSPQANFLLSTALHKDGQYGSALEHALRTVEWSHKQVDANKRAFYFVHAGRVLAKLKLFVAADALFRHAIDLGLNNAPIYKGYAEVLVAAKRRNEAVQCIDIAMSLDPNDASLRDFRRRITA